MSSNSKREQLLTALETLLSEITKIRTVSRVRPEFSELQNYASTQLPMIAISGSLPKPVKKLSQRTKNQPEIFLSEIRVDLFCYALSNVNPDSDVSDYADEIWAKLFSAPSLGKQWILGLDVSPEREVGIWDPYIVFKMTCTYTYNHGTGGI